MTDGQKYIADSLIEELEYEEAIKASMNELRNMGITTVEQVNDLEETDKAVYAILNLGCDSRKCMWVPKSVLEVGFDAAEIMHYETIFEENYDECVKLFNWFWKCYK